ncbi:MAG: nitrogen regulation protein NR(II) [Syntrophobacteraceae bacterium]
MNLPLLPIWLIEFVGSALMIILSFMCVRLARQLRDKDRENLVWTYLLYVAYALAGFALSRSVGHFAKLLLMATGYGSVWQSLKPLTGSINTIAFFVVASITLFFERTWRIYQQISKDRNEIRNTHEKLLFLNRNLENLVEARTRELALSERKYRRIFEVSRDLMAVITTDGHILDMNPAGKIILGIEPGEKDLPVFSSYFQLAGDWEYLADILRREGFTPDSEIQLKRDDAITISVIMNAAAEKNPDGTISSIQLMAKDISSRKAMEQQLLLADKLASIGQLAAGIAHEINNPLSIILGYTQLLLRNEQQGTQTHDDCKKIEKATRACKTIISDLLSFARSTPTRKGIGDIHGALKELLSVIQHQFELDGVHIKSHFDPELPQMLIDEGKMKQVFMNLLMNAKQAIGKKGQIDIRTLYQPENGKALIEVRDTGCGMEAEIRARIFDPFFTTKPTGEGTGLGLSVSYGIVKDHGGEIRVESKPGAGTLFTVILPVITGNVGVECSTRTF